MLVKTALFGQDANWGRILCATGYAGVPIDANMVSCGVGWRGTERVGSAAIFRCALWPN